MAQHKSKHGSDLTITGTIRKLSYYASASSMPNTERTEWYWDVISRAEYEARGQYKGDLSVSTFIDSVLRDINTLKIKEIKKTKEENNGK